jgi:uncharacterized protein YidB (DUF937 family)
LRNASPRTPACTSFTAWSYGGDTPGAADGDGLSFRLKRCDVRKGERSMGLFDSLKGALESEALPAMLNTVLAQTQYHDLPGLVAALEKGGLGPQVQSWLGNGTNMPITADQLKAVLGNSQVQEIARHFGLPVDQILSMLAQYLPEIVDKASPNGVLQPHA